jgi:SAM-dependent methyltransferase
MQAGPPDSGIRAMDPALTAVRWDAEYRDGRYLGEPPIAFVDEILSMLLDRHAMPPGIGLYIGCGNGRNYLPLVDAGARVYGLDLSHEALRQLRARRPGASMPLVCGDFRRFHSARRFDYLIALQVFQHGTAADVATYFANARDLLKPGGLFFLRVNSVATQIGHAHAVLERTDDGGVTVEYRAGPKQGLPVHFYAREELLALTRGAFDVVREPCEEIIMRTAPHTGFWAQWQAVWRRL